MNTTPVECRIVHRKSATHEDRLTLLVALLSWAETNCLTLRHFCSRSAPMGEFSFTVQIVQPEVIDDLLSRLPMHAIEDVEVNGQSLRLLFRNRSEAY